MTAVGWAPAPEDRSALATKVIRAVTPRAADRFEGHGDSVLPMNLSAAYFVSASVRYGHGRKRVGVRASSRFLSIPVTHRPTAVGGRRQNSTKSIGLLEIHTHHT